MNVHCFFCYERYLQRDKDLGSMIRKYIITLEDFDDPCKIPTGARQLRALNLSKF